MGFWHAGIRTFDSRPFFEPFEGDSYFVYKELLFRERPYPNLKMGQVIRAISDRILPQFPPRYDLDANECRLREGLQRICNLCWTHDPTKRPSMRFIREELVVMTPEVSYTEDGVH